MINGSLIIDKPAELTSQQCVSRVKHALLNSGLTEKGYKIGHGGTLDPFATGVMVVLLGEATKLADCYLHSKKTYTGIISLGSSTDTGDLTGSIRETMSVPTLSEGAWNELAQEFTQGEYWQTPPMYSAKKIDGTALHTLARKGIEIEREAILKKIESFTVKLISENELSFEVSCESGTYVRVLAEDLAKKAHTRAHLKSLRRTRSSDAKIDFSMELSKTCSWIENEKNIQKIPNFIPLKQTASHISSIRFPDEEVKAVRQGVSSTIHSILEALNREHPNHSYLIARDLTNQPVALFENQNREGFRLQRVLN